jgi:hypothetical protein
MKHIHAITILMLLVSTTIVFGQNNTHHKFSGIYPVPTLTIEPALVIQPNPMSDLGLSAVVQWNLHKRVSLASRSVITANTVFGRDFNYVHTDYSYSIGQTIGIGTSLYGKHAAHTISLMAGIQYDATKETLNNPEFENISMSSNSLSPDAGLMYNVKVGKGKVFFSYRMYIPLYPYPFKSTDITSIDGNMAKLSLEFGIGFRIN